MAQMIEYPRGKPLSQMTEAERVAYWNAQADSLLTGRKIVNCAYTTKEQNDELYWHNSGLIIALDNGVILQILQDDEGNGPGSIATNSEKVPCLPVL